MAVQVQEDDFWGPVISRYTREQAIEDGVLVDVTEWASADKGFIGGFTCPVAVTSAVWGLIDRKPMPALQDVRGRAHDVLFMASLALRAAMRQGEDAARFKVIVTPGTHTLVAVVDGDGVTIGEPGDF
jgi:hypothetical protein